MGSAFRARVGANESAFGTSSKARAAAAAEIGRLAWYGDPENHDLRVALASHHGISAGEVVVAAGIDDLLALAARACVGTGAAVMTAGSYATFIYEVAGHGGGIQTVPYRGYFTDPRALATAAREHCAAAVYLANPDNPAGSFHSASVVRALAADLPAGCPLLLDEAYIEFAPPDGVIPTSERIDNVIRLRTFSKAHGMAGARIGYCLCAAPIAAAFNKIRQHFGVNRVAQAAALASLGDTEFVAGVVSKVAAARMELTRIGAAAGLLPLPSSTNFVTFDTGSAAHADALLAELQRRRIFVRKPRTPPIDSWFRVTVGTPSDLAILAEELPAAIAALGRS
jgi:histidinol-phosphate aminotransferase